MQPDIFAQRRAQLQKKAKASKAETTQIAPAADQMKACLASQAKKSEELKEQQKRKLERLAEEDEKRKQGLLESDRRKAEFLKQAKSQAEVDQWDREIKELDDEEYGAQQAPKRPARCRPPPSVVRIAPLMPQPEFLERPLYRNLSEQTTHRTENFPSIEAISEMVDEKRETSVLVSFGEEVTTLHDIGVKSGKMPSQSEACYVDYTSWFMPRKWTELVRQRVSGNSGAFKAVTSTGNYNEVLATTTDTPMMDHAKWPCVLNSNIMPMVVRMTRSDPFPCAEGRTPAYRSMKLGDLKKEMSMTLHAAAHRFGPPVYAAVSWPWERRPKDKHQKYGLILVMLRMRSDITRFQNFMYDKLVIPHQPTAEGSTLDYRKCTEHISRSMILRCYEMANAGFINFDIKPGNMLVDHYGEEPDFQSPAVYITDFDAVYCVKVPDSVAGPKARFFVTLLLLSMHVRAYSRMEFVESYIRVAGPLLMELWEELVASYGDSNSKPFGEGAEWIYETEIAFDQERGAFNHPDLEKTTSLSTRLSMQMMMMAYEYMFDDSDHREPPKRVTEWPGWVRKRQGAFFEARNPRLVPQLMTFILFHLAPVPEDWKTILAA